MATVASLTADASTSVRPMLPSLARQPFDSPDYLYELKWDGIRALASVRDGRTLLTDRNGRDITHLFPELSQVRVQGRAGVTVLDGEIVCLGKDGRPSFPSLQERLTQETAHHSTSHPPASYMAFDVLYVNGLTVMGERLQRRKALLNQLLASSDLAQPCAYIEREGKAFFQATCQLGLEGIVAKEKSSLYSPGTRTSAWQQVKRSRECGFVIGGYTFGGQSREPFDALLLGLHNGRGGLEYVGSVSMGFTKLQARLAYASLTPLHTETCPFNQPPSMQKFLFWCRPELVCQVQYGEFSPDGELRYPAYLAMREDKAPEDCTLRDASGWPAELAHHA